jgi:hypothetical protein
LNGFATDDIKRVRWSETRLDIAHDVDTTEDKHDD